MEEKNTHIDELITAFLVEGLDREEMAELNTWINLSEVNRRYFMQRQEVWFSSVQAGLEQSCYNQEEAFEVFRKRVALHKPERKMPYRIGWKRICRYAAAVLVLGLISYFSYRGGESHLQASLKKVEVEAPLGSQTRLRLPDGTLVVLNAGSRIAYPQDFGVDSREVELVGEGYFEVVHDEQLPFRVCSKDLQVRVLGTKFNFRDYPEDCEAVVSLLEGKVALDNRLKKEGEMILLPDEQVVLNKAEGRMKKESKRVKGITEWTSGRLLFDEMPLSEVVRILERSYDVKISFADNSLKNFRFYGNFNRTEQGIKDILEALDATGKVRYTLKNKEVTLY